MDYYQLLDSGDGEKLEQWGQYTLVRPDPQIIWQKSLPRDKWDADGIFKGDVWHTKPGMPNAWDLTVEGLIVEARLTPFKHTGIFPEQAWQWSEMSKIIKSNSLDFSVLNLFGYTGMASLTCAQAGAKVVHVDASKPAIGWARRNQELSQLTNKPIRWILDDAIKFVQKEGRRGNKYQGILLDPPAYGHGPEGQAWQFNRSLPVLLEGLSHLLAENLKFVFINSYAITTSHLTLANVLTDLLQKHVGEIKSGELVLSQKDSDRKLSTGIWGCWISR